MPDIRVCQILKYHAGQADLKNKLIGYLGKMFVYDIPLFQKVSQYHYGKDWDGSI